NPAVDPSAACQGRCDGQRPGGALRDKPALCITTSEGVGEGWPDKQRPLGTMATMPTRGSAAPGGGGLDGAVSAILREPLRPPRRALADDGCRAGGSAYHFNKPDRPAKFCWNIGGGKTSHTSASKNTRTRRELPPPP